jgi:hypothetical protein
MDDIKKTAEIDAFLFGESIWIEMDEAYYESLRAQYGKDETEIGPRKYKTYLNKDLPIYIILIPAGKQHNGERVIQYFHLIVEDFELGECNGSYELIDEDTLFNKFNIKYN